MSTKYEDIINLSTKIMPQLEVTGLLALTKDPSLSTIGTVMSLCIITNSLKELTKPKTLERSNPYSGNRIKIGDSLEFPSVEETYKVLLDQLENNKSISNEDKQLFKLFGMYISDWSPAINYEQAYEQFRRVRVNYIRPNNGNYALHHSHQLDIPPNETPSNERMLKLHEFAHGIIHIPDYVALDEGVVVLVLSQYWNNKMPVYNYNYSTTMTALIYTLVGKETFMISANSFSNEPIIERLTEIIGSKDKVLELLELTTKYYETYRKGNIAAKKAEKAKRDVKTDAQTNAMLNVLAETREEFTRKFKPFADIQIEKGELSESDFDYSNGYVTLTKPINLYEGSTIFINGVPREHLSREKYNKLIEYFNYDSLLVHRILESISEKIDFDIIKGKGLIFRDKKEEEATILSDDELRYILVPSGKRELTIEELTDYIIRERMRIEELKGKPNSPFNGQKESNREIEKLIKYLGIDRDIAIDFITRLDSTVKLYEKDDQIEIKSVEFDEDGMLYVDTISCKKKSLESLIHLITSINIASSPNFSMIKDTIGRIESGSFDEQSERVIYLNSRALIKDISVNQNNI